MSKKTKILVVEDEPAELQVLVEALRSVESYEVLSAPDAVEGFRSAKVERPSLIISDNRMPRVSGFEFCKMVKSEPDLSGTIFVVCTAMGDVASKTEGVNVGADDYLTKPVSFDELLLRVQALLRLKMLQDELAEDKQELEKLNRELQADFDGIISLLMKVLALRVPNAVARAEQSSVICEWIADRLDLDDITRKAVTLAGRLREIGKVSLPDELLRKDPRQYTESERDQMEKYPVLGQLIVGDIPQLKNVAIFLRHQNENYDGTGYPDRLTGVQISLGSRVLRALNLVQSLLEKHIDSPASVRTAIMESIGTILDPRIAQLVEEYVRITTDSSWKVGKRALRLEHLQEGMVLANDVVSGQGMMLLSKDSRLTQSQVTHLMSLSHFDPIIQEIYIYDPPP